VVPSSPAKTGLLIGALILAGLAGCSNDSSGGAPGEVVMGADRFEPEELTVSVGDTVTWSNDSSQVHTVTAYADEIPDGAPYFASGGATDEDDARDDLSAGILEGADTFEVTFDEPGTYRYFCIPHEGVGMTGTIIVEQ